MAEGRLIMLSQPVVFRARHDSGQMVPRQSENLVILRHPEQK
jgi:hypothetical protein